MARQKITVGVIGLGLIGGSAAIKLRQQGFTGKILGYDNNSAHAQEALVLGIVDELSELEGLCEQAELILMAIPVNNALKVLPELMTRVKPSTVVADFGSTKKKNMYPGRYPA